MIRPLPVLLTFTLTSCILPPERLSLPGELAAAVRKKSPALRSLDVFSHPGGCEARIESREWRPDHGKALRFSVYRPASPKSDALVILGHGFFRSRKTMARLAEHVSSHGVSVATLDFRHSRPWAGRHRENAADMNALAGHLAANRVIYAGFSAGGLSALIAAADDPRSIGFLGLDLVDDGSGEDAAAAIRFPLHGLRSVPSKCNAQGNGRAVYAAADRSIAILVKGAGHCDFEFPADWKCRSVCGPREPTPPPGEIRTLILGLATASLAEQAGAAPAADPWWKEGSAGLQSLRDEHRIE